MKVYIVSYGWYNNNAGQRHMTPRAFANIADAKAFVDDWMKDCSTMKFSIPFAFYDEIEVE